MKLLKTSFKLILNTEWTKKEKIILLTKILIESLVNLPKQLIVWILKGIAKIYLGITIAFGFAVALFEELANKIDTWDILILSQQEKKEKILKTREEIKTEQPKKINIENSFFNKKTIDKLK